VVLEKLQGVRCGQPAQKILVEIQFLRGMPPFERPSDTRLQAGHSSATNDQIGIEPET
jgi:hypothetical protein